MSSPRDIKDMIDQFIKVLPQMIVAQTASKHMPKLIKALDPNCKCGTRPLFNELIDTMEKELLLEISMISSQELRQYIIYRLENVKEP